MSWFKQVQCTQETIYSTPSQSDRTMLLNQNNLISLTSCSYNSISLSFRTFQSMMAISQVKKELDREQSFGCHCLVDWIFDGRLHQK